MINNIIPIIKILFFYYYLLNAIPLGTCEKAIKPVNTVIDNKCLRLVSLAFFSITTELIVSLLIRALAACFNVQVYYSLQRLTIILRYQIHYLYHNNNTGITIITLLLLLHSSKMQPQLVLKEMVKPLPYKVS